MLQIDLSQEPLTYQELHSELELLKKLRKAQIKYSCISDVAHAFVFIALYFSHFLRGYSVLIAVAMSTVVAVIMATVIRQSLRLTDWIIISAFSLGTACTTAFVLFSIMREELGGSLVAGIAAGSIVIVGATLGRKIKQVMVTIEDLKPITEDEQARQELTSLCREHPELEEYRHQAAINLRPNLTYLELHAMRDWVANHNTSHSADTEPVVPRS